MKGFAKFKYYGLPEWVAAIIGVLICFRVTYRYMLGAFDNSPLADYIIPVGSISFGLILMAAPLDVMDWFRSKMGISQKRDKIEKDDFTKKTGIDPDEPLIKETKK